MILDTTLKLEAVLAGAVSANQPEYHVDYVDRNTAGEETMPAFSRGALNSASDVTILSAPTSNTPRREIQRISIYNKDTASITVTIKTDDGTTERILIRKTIGTLDSLCWEKGLGWYTTATGAGIFTTLVVTGASTLTGAVSMGSTANVVGDFSVATNKFTVAAASGNTLVAGTLNVTGNALFDVATGSRFTSTGLGVFTTPSYGLDHAKSASGSSIYTTVRNTSNTASSNAVLYAETAGSSAGDPYVQLINSVINWSVGLDNSDSDKFKISNSSAPGSSDYLTIDTSGQLDLPAATVAAAVAVASTHKITLNVNGTPYYLLASNV